MSAFAIITVFLLFSASHRRGRAGGDVFKKTKIKRFQSGFLISKHTFKRKSCLYLKWSFLTKSSLFQYSRTLAAIKSQTDAEVIFELRRISNNCIIISVNNKLEIEHLKIIFV